jgi:hypothetical protein
MDFLRFDYYPPNDPTPIEERESKKRDEEQGSRPPGMENRTYLRKRKINWPFGSKAHSGRFTVSEMMYRRADVDHAEQAPNLQLNLPHSISSLNSKIHELWWAAFLASVLQILVLFVSGLTTFFPHFKNMVGAPNIRDAFWIFLAGTLCLNSGMFFCSWVIDHSTVKLIWRQNHTRTHQASNIKRPTKAYSNERDRGFHLFWLQHGQIVNDQRFEPCLIHGGYKDEVLTSRRIDANLTKPWHGKSFPSWTSVVAASWLEFLSIAGAFLGIAGFIVQLEGLRNLTWPTTVAQILAVLVMAFIRAFVRRRLAEAVSYVPAWENHELDCEYLPE